MFEELRAIVAENLGVEESELTMETSFREDLEADSLDLFEMVMAVEEKYDVGSSILKNWKISIRCGCDQV